MIHGTKKHPSPPPPPDFLANLWLMVIISFHCCRQKFFLGLKFFTTDDQDLSIFTPNG